MSNGTKRRQILQTQSKSENNKVHVHRILKKQISANKENPWDQGLPVLAEAGSL